MNDITFDGTTGSSYNKWRKLKDKWATWTISLGGVSVLAAILLIFFYLFYEIMPMFQSATLKYETSYSQPGDNGAVGLHLAVEEQEEIGFRLDSSAKAHFFRLETGEAIQSRVLPLADVAAFSIDNEENRAFVVADSNGKVVMAKHQYKVSYPNDVKTVTPSIEYLFADQDISFSGAPISVAMRDTEESVMVIASVDGRLEAHRFDKEEDFLSEEIVLEAVEVELPELDIKAARLMLAPRLDWLYAVAANGDFRLIDLRRSEVVDAGSLFEKEQSIASLRFLLGGISVMVGGSAGEMSQWFVVTDENGARLQRVRDFEAGGEAIELVATEHRRKGFVTISEDNELRIFHSTAHRRVLDKSLDDIGKVRAIAISPRAKRLITETEDAKIHIWKLHNEHPEVSWSALWEKVWYESYDEPEYTWQSSAANNDFEPKYSLAPLAFGTLKAAFYAMIVAAPLAICGAIYTAYFMAPSLRRKVKPLIELMEALPTVILGFLAGLWLAPFIEKNMPAIFSIMLLLPFSVLAFAWIWEQLPVGFRKHVPDGWHPVLLIPVIILVVMFCVALSIPMEQAFFGGDMRQWITSDLGISFDQRNSLVVGIAMGFAVIPTIFSIAEDAIFSVPKHLSQGSLALGASPWQTLIGVVIPTASPGIFSAMMIGMGRAVGETMIVLMATGNTPIMDMNIFEGMRTLSANIAVEIGETEVDSTHYRVLFLAAFVLFMFTFVVNTIAETVRQSLRKRYGNL